MYVILNKKNIYTTLISKEENIILINFEKKTLRDDIYMLIYMHEFSKNSYIRKKRVVFFFSEKKKFDLHKFDLIFI